MIKSNCFHDSFSSHETEEEYFIASREKEKLAVHSGDGYTNIPSIFEKLEKFGNIGAIFLDFTMKTGS